MYEREIYVWWASIFHFLIIFSSVYFSLLDSDVPQPSKTLSKQSWSFLTEFCGAVEGDGRNLLKFSLNIKGKILYKKIDIFSYITTLFWVEIFLKMLYTFKSCCMFLTSVLLFIINFKNDYKLICKLYLKVSEDVLL